MFISHLCEVLKQQSAILLTRTETERLLQRARDEQPSLVDKMVPATLSLSDMQQILQNLLKEKMSIRNLKVIRKPSSTSVATARTQAR